MLKFLTKKSTIIGLLSLALALFLIPADLLAQTNVTQVSSVGSSTGPFEAFLQRGTQLFGYTRNALFVVAAFVFIAIAFTGIKDGKIEWEKIFYLVVALVLIGVAGFIVSYMANPNNNTNLQNQYQNLSDTEGWQ